MNLLDATTEFHTLADLPTGEFVQPHWTTIGEHGRKGAVARTVTGKEPMTSEAYVKLRELRRELLREEYKEYRDGEVAGDIVEIVDGLLDIIVIAWGTLLAYVGKEMAEAAATQVAISNLSKVDGTLGEIVRREDGKLLKPEGWQPPDIKGALGL